jgi:hypothetical protein
VAEAVTTLAGSKPSELLVHQHGDGLRPIAVLLLNPSYGIGKPGDPSPVRRPRPFSYTSSNPKTLLNAVAPGARGFLAR